MADITAKLIIFRVNETLTNMAEWGLPKFFYTDDTRQHLDVVNMLFVGWILLGIFVYFLGTFIASRLPSRPRSSSSHPLSTADSSDPASNAVNNSKAPNSVDSPVSVGKAAGGGIVKRRQNVGQFGREAVPTGPQYPVSVGADSHSVQWVNDILVWLMSRASVAWLAEGWMSALNDRTIKSSPEHGILVEFDRVLANCPPPELLDIRTDAESNNNVTVNGRVVSRNLGMVITATRNTGRETASVEYELFIEKIDGKIRVACTTEDSLLVIRFVERPDVKLSLKPASGITKFQNLDQRALEDAIVDIIITALASSVVDLHMQHDPDFPKYPKRKPGSESVFTPHNSVPTVARHERRLLVKVIKATNIGGKKGCQEPFCVVEMDDPPQRYQTSSLQDTNSPFWDEHFLFNLKSGSAELLFEIYDRGKKMGENFLGLGIVSVEELLKNPSQRQIISMQSRPMEKDSVTGALTVEFLFMEGSEVPVKGQHGKVETNSRVTPAGTVITTTTIKNTGEEDGGEFACRDGLQCFRGMNLPLSVTTLSPLCPPRPISPPHHPLAAETCADGGRTVLSPSGGSDSDFTSQSVEGPIVVGVHRKKGVLDEMPLLPIEKRRTFPRTSPNAIPSRSLSKLLSDSSSLERKKHFLETMINGGVSVETSSAPDLNWLTHPSVRCELDPTAVSESVKSDARDSAVKANSCGMNGDDLPPSECDSSTLAPSIQVIPSTPNPAFPEHAPKKFRIRRQSMESLGKDSNDVANTALRELENRGKTSMNTSKSTLIVHSVQREIVRPLVKVKLDKDGKWHEVEQANGEGTDSPSSRSDRGSLFGSSSPTASERNNSERARSKERKSFIGTLRKRLSFKKNRSKSMEQKDDSMPESLSSSRSVSADRSKSVPSSRETSTGRAGGGRLDVPAKMRIKGFRGIKAGSRLDTSSTRSSVSEGSAISGASNRTYINENSTLIIEINENGITKHYLIPYSLATRSKWKKRGVKLHVYNDHTFVAKHVAGSTVCQACTRRFSRRPGKQGYECRECNLQCHKTCHVKVETKCPNSTIHTLEMEYVQDPKAKGKVS